MKCPQGYQKAPLCLLNFSNVGKTSRGTWRLNAADHSDP